MQIQNFGQVTLRGSPGILPVPGPDQLTEDGPNDAARPHCRVTAPKPMAFGGV